MIVVRVDANAYFFAVFHVGQSFFYNTHDNVVISAYFQTNNFFGNTYREFSQSRLSVFNKFASLVNGLYVKVSSLEHKIYILAMGYAFALFDALLSALLESHLPSIFSVGGSLLIELLYLLVGLLDHLLDLVLGLGNQFFGLCFGFGNNFLIHWWRRRR